MSNPRIPIAASNGAAVPDQAAVPRYTAPAIALHWLIALLIAGGFGLGVYMVDLHMSPIKLRLFAYHKWIGITVLALALLRLGWRLTHRPPEEPPMPRWQLRVMQWTHILLYVLMLVTPLCGWLYSSASGYPVVYLKLWQLPDLVHKNRDLAKVLEEVHGTLGWAIGWLVALHVGAALKHQFVDHDGIVRRMWFGRSSGTTTGGPR